MADFDSLWDDAHGKPSATTDGAAPASFDALWDSAHPAAPAKPAERPGFVETFLHDVNPLNSVPALVQGLFSNPERVQANTPEHNASLSSAVADAAARKKNGLGPMMTPEEVKNAPVNPLNDPANVPGWGEMAGHGAAAGVNGAALGLATDGLVRGVPAAARAIKRTVNPDLAMVRALSPNAADTSFPETIGRTRGNIARGAQLADVDLANMDTPTAIKATQASMDEHMQALEAHKARARLRGDRLSTARVKANAIANLPKGLEHSDPVAYHEAVDHINGLFPNKKYLETDEVFNQAQLNNGQLSSFHAGKDAAQKNKLITNGGDTAVLKAIGDTYRGWISEHLGPLAADLNEQWGQLNGVKHYLQNKQIAAVKQKPLTPLAGLMDKFGIRPEAGAGGLKHGLLQGIADKVSGVPSKIDDLIKSAMSGTEPALSPVEPASPGSELSPFDPNHPTWKVATKRRQLPPAPTRAEGVPDTSGPIYNERNNPMNDKGQRLLPAASSGIGVSGTTVPDVVGRSSRGSGSHQNLLGAPAPGEAPLNVQGPGPTPGREILGANPRAVFNTPGDPTGVQGEVITGRTHSASGRQGLSHPNGRPGEPPPMTATELKHFLMNQLFNNK